MSDLTIRATDRTLPARRQQLSMAPIPSVGEPRDTSELSSGATSWTPPSRGDLASQGHHGGEVKLLGGIHSVWQALRSAGYSDREIQAQGLVGQVARLNHLANPSRVQAGQTLSMPGGAAQPPQSVDARHSSAHTRRPDQTPRSSHPAQPPQTEPAGKSSQPAQPPQSEQAPNRPPEQARSNRTGTTGKDREILARAIAAESRGEPYQSQVAVAQTIANHARLHKTSLPCLVRSSFLSSNFDGNKKFYSVATCRIPHWDQFYQAAGDALAGKSPVGPNRQYFHDTSIGAPRWVNKSTAVQVGHMVFYEERPAAKRHNRSRTMLARTGSPSQDGLG